MAAPKEVFGDMLRFAGASLDLGAMGEAMEMSLRFSAPESLRTWGETMA